MPASGAKLNTGPTTAEFQAIERLAIALAGDDPQVVCGIGDDAAVLQPGAGQQLVTCTDTLVAGVHFPAQASAADIGWKSLAVNLSDLAAMGARPRYAQLSLTLPELSSTWLDGFIEGWRPLAQAHGVTLIGGDTTRGPLSITVQLLGETSPDKILRRSGGRPGDLLAVTGSLGAAALALRQLQSNQQPAPDALDRLHRPQPRVTAGQALAGLASACIDLSDGLANDLDHLLRASGVGAEVSVAALPIDALLDGLSPQQRLNLALGGGDDYELCCSVPEHAAPRAKQLLAELDLKWTPIGRLTADRELVWQERGSLQITEGWRHFAGTSK